MSTSITGISPDLNLGLARSYIRKMPLNGGEKGLNTVQEYQKYHTMDMLMRKERLNVSGADAVIDRIDLSEDGNADRVVPFQEVGYSIDDNLQTKTVTFARYRVGYVLEDEEVGVNKGGNYGDKVADLVELRRWPKVKAMAKTCEDDTWNTPLNSTDTERMYGFPYWLNKANSGVTTGGFVGYTIRFRDGTTTLTDKAGINPTTYAKYRNYADIYSDISNYQDIGTRLEKAVTQLNFEPPMDARDLVAGPRSRFKLYTGLSTRLELTNAFRAGGDAFGLTLNGGIVGFNNIPIIRVNPLDDDSHGAIYGVNWEYFRFNVQKGNFMYEPDPMRDANRPRVLFMNIYNHCNLDCTNVRLGGFVLHTVTAA